ncbi:MAG TPA: PQQ-binding-like beta-propeller repeat protein [Kribbellaceae bacterium]
MTAAQMRIIRPVVTALIGAAAVAGCTSGDGGRVVPKAPERAPAWEATLDDLGPTREASVAGDTVVVKSETLVVGLSRSDGKLRWKLPVDHNPRVRVTATSVIVYDDGYVTAYDVRTSRPAFSYESQNLARSVVSTGAVYTHECLPEARKCVVTARALPGGRVRWRYGYTRPAGDTADVPSIEIPGDSTIRYAESKRRVEPLVARPANVVAIVREGRRPPSSVAVLDAATGKLIGSRQIETIWARVVDERTGLLWRDTKACEVALTGYDVRTGRQTWSHPAARWNEVDSGRPADCENGAWTPAIDGTVAAFTTTDHEAELIELDNGKVRWTGEAGTHVVDVSAGTVLARVGNGTGPLVGLDSRNGHERWRIDLPDDYGAARVDRPALLGDRLAFSLADTSANPAREVLQVWSSRTGQAQWSAPASNWILGVGPDWIVTAADGAEEEGPKTIRLFTG